MELWRIASRVLVGAALVLTACTDHDSPTAPSRPRGAMQSPAPLDEGGGSKLIVQALDPNVRMLAIEVNAKDLERPLEFKLEGGNDGVVGTIAVPAGEERQIVMHAYDGDGRETHRGETTMMVEKELNPQVDLELEPVEKGETLDASVGSYRVEIEMKGEAIPGSKLLLTALIIDPDGRVSDYPPLYRSDWRHLDPKIGDLEPSDSPVTVYTVDLSGIDRVIYCRDSFCGHRKIVADPYKMVSVGEGHTCGLKESGSANCWGADYYGQSATWDIHNYQFSTISAGSQHTCAIDVSGRGRCWGLDNHGQLGDGFPSPNGNATVQYVQGGLTFIDITAGGGHSCGIVTGGAAYCWGKDDIGQLGDDVFAGAPDESTPLAVEMPVGVSFRQIDAGQSTTCAVSTADQLYCWGAYDGGLPTAQANALPTACSYATLCRYMPKPTLMQGGAAYRSVSVGYNRTCAVTPGNVVYCWGSGGWWGNSNYSNNPMQPVAGGQPYQMVSAEGSNGCLVTTASVIYCWGPNLHGMLGINDTNVLKNAYSPLQVAGSWKYLMVSTAFDRSCAVTLDKSEIHCWGANGNWQLGVGDGYDRYLPVKVLGWK
jgi:alpha-tubulin suppressor-like RCC1 family protein